MLKTQMTQYIEKLLSKKQQPELELYKEEKDYTEKYHLFTNSLKETVVLTEKEAFTRFNDAYIERGDKETEEFLAEETASFLDQPITYFKNHINEFMYLESEWFDLIGVDAISFEADNVFGTYDVMLGLKQPKKMGDSIKSLLMSELSGEEATFDLMFSQNDGLWDLNFALNDLNEFLEEWTIREAYVFIYRFLFKLVETVEEGK